MNRGKPMCRAQAFWAVAVVAILAGCGKEPESKMTESSPVTYHQSGDPEMLRANQEARKTFRYFWKEISWDFNRIIPAVNMGSIKLVFSDDPSNPESYVEHMWVGDIDFDGERIRGVLRNTPVRLSSFKEGDSVECSPDEISDWMCVVGDQVYGGYTVQVTRSRMSDAERAAYDAKWGVEFPPPDKVLLPPDSAKIDANIALKLAEHLDKEPDAVHSTDDFGRMFLHLAALYGRKQSVKVLLEHGADVTKRCNRGWKAIDYAKALEWSEIVEMLSKAEGGEGDGADEATPRR